MVKWVTVPPKLRQMVAKLENSDAVCGFAGSLADAFTLMEGLENMMSKYPDQTMRACIKYAKEWRTGKN